MVENFKILSQKAVKVFIEMLSNIDQTFDEKYHLGKILVCGESFLTAAISSEMRTLPGLETSWKNHCPSKLILL
jgi:hypothetical protein